MTRTWSEIERDQDEEQLDWDMSWDLGDKHGEHLSFCWDLEGSASGILPGPPGSQARLGGLIRHIPVWGNWVGGGGFQGPGEGMVGGGRAEGACAARPSHSSHLDPLPSLPPGPLSPPPDPFLAPAAALGTLGWGQEQLWANGTCPLSTGG